ncbi:glycosyltransferase family 9 protein [Massilia forsythiae]|nr:glycosyltransferase family 9 protein [Massilia forsythiae]
MNAHTTPLDAAAPAMAPAWRRARRILCVRLDSLGDVLMCTPAMRALRDSVPGRSLTLLASPAGAAAAAFVPEIDDVIVHRAPWMKDGGEGSSGARPDDDMAAGAGPAERPQSAAAPVAGLADALAARAFDAAVIFTTYTQSALPAALLCHLAGIPLRLAHCRENPYRLLSDWVADPEPATMVRHEVQRQLALVKRVGCRTADQRLSFALRPADLDTVRALLRSAGIDPGRPWLLLHPGASAAARRYPPGRWMQAMRLLAQHPGLPLVLTGSAAESALAGQLRDGAGIAAPVHSLAGRLSLGELGAAVRLAAVAITNNTGPAHIAAALGTPVVDLYALTNPQHTPWAVRSRVLFEDVPCRFCFKSSCPMGHHACLDGVAPERIVQAVRELLEPARQADTMPTS